MTDLKPLTEQQLTDIETRAAHLHEYATLTDVPLQADADQLTGEDVPALLAAVRRLRAERDAFRDQRNGVFKTNERLIAEVQQSDQARLRAENETRTATRANLEAAERAQRVIEELRARVAEMQPDVDLLEALRAYGVDNWDGYDEAIQAAESASS